MLPLKNVLISALEYSIDRLLLRAVGTHVLRSEYSDVFIVLLRPTCSCNPSSHPLGPVEVLVVTLRLG